MKCPTCQSLLAEGRAHCRHIECAWVQCRCGDLIDTTRTNDDDPTDDTPHRRTTDGPDDQ